MKHSLQFSSHPEELASVRAFAREFLGHTGLSEKDSELLVLGLNEACANIIRHAYQHVPEQPITLVCERAPEGIRFRLRDFSAKTCLINPEGRPLDQITPGGLGMHLIRHAFDQVEFHPRKPGTELVLLKRL